MKEIDLKLRTKQFALRTIKLVSALPKNYIADVLGKQLLRSGTSVGANYRAACRGKSKADFVNKLLICLEEVDESAYWLELLWESEIMEKVKLENLHKEAEELTAIFSSSITTSKSNINEEKNLKSKI
jgi:four helix bundle protein